VLERFHLEVSGSHPGLYRAEGMLDISLHHQGVQTEVVPLPEAAG